MIFDPVHYSDGRRWSIRWNWAGHGLPVDGDHIRLKGFSTSLDMDHITSGDLDLGGGVLDVLGQLKYTGTLTPGTGGTLHIRGSGQFYLSGYSGPEVLKVSTQAGLLVIEGNTTTIGAGRTLRVNNNADAGIDGSAGGTATLTFDPAATLEIGFAAMSYTRQGVGTQTSYFPYTTQRGRIRERRSGIDGPNAAAAANVSSVVNLTSMTTRP